jgi:Transposase DDE domain
MGTEALLAVGYAVFLLLVATGLDVLARHSHRRSDRYRTAGFTFRPDLDLWECPEGQQLRLVDTDHRQRLAHYRASPAVCNACPVKGECTDSDHGRRVTRALDPWPHSEAGRFHRGLCVVLVVLAAVIAGVALIRSDGATEAAALATVLGLALVIASRLLADFRRLPSGFPGASGSASSEP